jgi:hypothetical protein
MELELSPRRTEPMPEPRELGTRRKRGISRATTGRRRGCKFSDKVCEYAHRPLTQEEYDAEQVYARLRFAKNSKHSCGKCGGKHQEQYCTGELKCTHCNAVGHLATFCYARRRLESITGGKEVTFRIDTCQLKRPEKHINSLRWWGLRSISHS